LTGPTQLDPPFTVVPEFRFPAVRPVAVPTGVGHPLEPVPVAEAVGVLVQTEPFVGDGVRTEGARPCLIERRDFVSVDAVFTPDPLKGKRALNNFRR